MLTKIMTFFAAFALAASSAPAVAQEAEPPRTTYQLIFVKFKPGAMARWRELFETYTVPAQAASGIPPDEVHRFHSGKWDVMIKTEMLEGMAGQDTYASPYRAAFMAKLIELAGSREAVQAIGEEIDSLIDERERYFTYTHP